MISYSYLWILLSLSLIVGLQGETCDANDEEFLISFHPHLDAFWLNTDDELKNPNFRPEGFLYAMNQRNSRQIFDSMLQSLSKSSKRKYFISEGVFFKDWYDHLAINLKEEVKRLVSNGQLEITNGGWVENDEAVCYVDDIIDQYTIGHNFLKKQFGIVPTIAWATDSFGHSHSQVAIEHILGFESQGIQRIDDRYINDRKGQTLLEFYWSPVSESTGLKYGGVYTHIRHFLHEYIDYRRMSSQSVADDHSRIQPVLKKNFRRNKLFRFVGNDFEEFIPKEFEILEGAFQKLNENVKGQCKKYKWGNPSEYFSWIKKDSDIPVRESDFLPNYDQNHYWAGYYTSNPELKIICKDFSRILNLYRKIYIKHVNTVGTIDPTFKSVLNTADELVSIMQHHDGITATSKYHIEQLFKQRMRNSTEQIIKAIQSIKDQRGVVCSLYNKANRCSLESLSGSTVYLTILHEGVNKKERIELVLPPKTYYEAEQDKQDSIFCSIKGDCILIFNAELKTGQTTIKLNSIDPDSRQNMIVKEQEYGEMKFSGLKFEVEINKTTIKYSQKGGQFIQISFVRSANTVTNVQTETWDKFGKSIKKMERRVPGIYIMANTGNIEDIPDLKLHDLKVSQGQKYSKITVFGGQQSVIANLSLTISNENLSVVQVEAVFKPNTWQQFDYFVKIDSSVKGKDSFFHDVNGYLVSKRKIGERLDYNWEYRQDDKINANTYPMCSFAYVIQGNKKMIVFTDRAQGVTLYDQSLLVNIDRLTGDDYKGVGEGYNKMVTNTFKFKIGVVDSKDKIQRLWQRQYDEPLLGFFSKNAPLTVANPNPSSANTTLLKYTVFILNSQEFVLRLHNLNEVDQLEVPKFTQNSWKIDDLGLNLQYQGIRESFANGIVLQERKMWKNIPGQINVFNAGSKDTSSKIVLEPLQIRSFRVNTQNKIEGPKSALISQSVSTPETIVSLTEPEKQLNVVSILNAKPLKQPFLRRCF